MDPMGMKSISLLKPTQVFVKWFFWGGSDGVVNPIFKSATIELCKYSCRRWKWIMGTSNKVSILHENNTFRSHFERNSIFNPVLSRCYLSLGGRRFHPDYLALRQAHLIFCACIPLKFNTTSRQEPPRRCFFCRPVSKGQNKQRNHRIGAIWLGLFVDF